jgi:UDP-N-acetylmuramoyl-tripeptide--D-alanyl-D-alanine ligase
MISITHLTKCSSLLDSLAQYPALPEKLAFCSDSRKYQHPSFFVAIPGSRVNPLDIIDNLLKQECPLVIYQDIAENAEKVSILKSNYPATVFLRVSDSISFLQELAHLHIEEWKSKNNKNKLFAISGSNGKTTHKEMLSFILNNIRPGGVVATEKNNNNHLGVPLTLLQVNENTEIVVLELGSNHPGEIKKLCEIAQPHNGLTTNIGATHLEFFGTEENVFEEEGHLYYSVKQYSQGHGLYLINADDPYLSRLESFPGTITFGENSRAQARITFYEHGASITWSNKVLRVTNNHITGRHNKLNLITCAFIAQYFYPDLEKAIIKAASAFTPTKNRSQWIDFNQRPVYLDAYNANPSSMRAALEAFKDSVLERGIALDQSCLVLGDMNELGDSTPRYHREMGLFLKEQGFKHVHFVGRYAEFYREGQSSGTVWASASELKPEFRTELVKNYSIFFIKGSRSLQLESLFDIT